MFQSYEYQKYIGYDAATKEYRCQYKIIDSDFEEVVVGVEVGVRVVRVGVGIAVIEVYKKRNLNVAANLMKTILYLHKRHPVYSIQKFIEDNRKYNPKFAQYQADIEKYLCLL
jgi:hypothetical protein